MEIIGKYGRATVMTEDIESEAVAQIYEFMNAPISEGRKCVIQSDVHAGKGCVVGFTMQMNPNIMDPDLCGCDIGCGVVSVCYDPRGLDLNDLALLDHRIRKTIPLGMEINEKSVISEKEFIRFLRTRLERAESIWPEMIHFPDKIDEKWIATTLRRLSMDPGVFWKSLGTLGGGEAIE